jgi:nitrite reductase/ring-hydroxylating ferredoxin subunit
VQAVKVESPSLAALLASAPLPLWPDAWYVVARSRDVVRDRIVDGRIADRSFVLFRDQAGGLVALDAHCPHMGAHLKTGQVVGDRIRCALHHMTIGRDGVLVGEAPCDRFRSRAWSVFERFGLVFVFAGSAPALPRPFADLPDDYAWTPAQPMLLKADWRAVLVNGFDVRHMRAVHQRAVVGLPDLSRTADGALRMQYRTQITPGGGLSSWLTRRLSRGSPHIRQTCYGPTMLVESRLGRFESRAVFGLVAHGANTLAYASFGAPKTTRLLRPRLWITQALYTAFLRKDFGVLEDMRLIVDGVADPGVEGVSQYLRSLPDLGVDRGLD